MKRKIFWFVVDHDQEGKVIRGPYLCVETASEVRKELEDRYPESFRNLWIVTRLRGEG